MTSCHLENMFFSGYRARRKSSARRNSTLEPFRQKGGGRKFSLKPEDDEEEDENKLVIKDGRVKPKCTEERAKIPKLKCSLLQDYARSRVSEEVEDDLLSEFQALEESLHVEGLPEVPGAPLPAATAVEELPEAPTREVAVAGTGPGEEPEESERVMVPA